METIATKVDNAIFVTYETMPGGLYAVYTDELLQTVAGVRSLLLGQLYTEWLAW